MNDIKVLLADDHRIVRLGLTTLIETEPGIRVVGNAENGIEAVHLFKELRPDVTMMDLMMPRLDGIEATRKIRAADPAPDFSLGMAFPARPASSAHTDPRAYSFPACRFFAPPPAYQGGIPYEK